MKNVKRKKLIITEKICKTCNVRKNITSVIKSTSLEIIKYLIMNTVIEIIKHITRVLYIVSIIYWLLVPFTYLTYVFYIRLMLVSEPRLVFIPLSYTKLFFIGIIIIGLILRISNLLKTEEILPTRETKDPIILKVKGFLEKFNKHVNILKINCYRIILGDCLWFIRFLLKFATWFYKLSNKTTLIIIFGLEIIPRVIVLIAFLIDIIYFREIMHTYKVIGILLLPLLLSIFERILKQFYEDNTEDQLNLIQTDREDLGPGKYILYYSFKNEEDNPDFIKNLNIEEFLMQHVMPTHTIEVMLNAINFLRDYYKFNLWKIFISTCFLIGWSVIFIVGIIL